MMRGGKDAVQWWQGISDQTRFAYKISIPVSFVHALLRSIIAAVRGWVRLLKWNAGRSRVQDDFLTAFIEIDRHATHRHGSSNTVPRLARTVRPCL